VELFATAMQPYPGRRWLHAGREVPIDVVGAFPGPEHCSQQSAVILTIGRPVGTGYGTSHRHTTYVRDPKRVLPANGTAFVTVTSVPAGTQPTGYTLNGIALWLGADDARFAYLVSDNGADIERWPAWTGPGCA
jgi:hypothetical protein